MSDESKEKRHHEQHHPHHPRPHEHHAPAGERKGIHPAWWIVLGGIFIGLIVFTWTFILR